MVDDLHLGQGRSQMMTDNPRLAYTFRLPCGIEDGNPPAQRNNPLARDFHAKRATVVAPVNEAIVTEVFVFSSK